MLIRADARKIPLIDGCVQAVVTSPPYFGLRDYGHAGQIGLEASPADYLSTLVAVFTDVRRVLADDGVCWLNLGDSYAGSWGAQGRPQGDGEMSDRSVVHARQIASHPRFDGLTGTRGRELGMKPKDLMMIPARAALALQADGWYLRSDVIWHKPNPMPESVTDRPTKSHEYLFLLTKSERYFYDQKAIYEPYALSTLREADDGYEGLGLKDYTAAGVQNPSDTKRSIIESIRRRREPTRGEGYGAAKGNTALGNTPDRDGGFGQPEDGRNKRSVWTIPTMPFSGWTKTSRRVRVSWDESDGDTTRTTSPDCPVHGDSAVRAAKVLCGERVGDALTSSERSDSGPDSSPLFDSVPTDQPPVDCSAAESLDSSRLSHAAPATSRSSRSRKTVRAPLTTSPCSVSAETPDGIGGTSASPQLNENGTHMLLSNTPDRDGQAVAALAETLGCTVGKCSCEYYKIITENMSHFATMPEALVEPCILAGSRFGDLIYDPFSGSGTVLAVAQRLGRRGVGTDLNPAYHELAKKRTAQRGLRFDALAEGA